MRRSDRATAPSILTGDGARKSSAGGSAADPPTRFRSGRKNQARDAKAPKTVNDRSTTQRTHVAPTAAYPVGRRFERPDVLVAIIGRADQMGIAAWRVTTALGISAHELEAIEAQVKRDPPAQRWS